MDLTKLIYHYTSFEKLQCILRYGTLRFKESTSSNVYPLAAAVPAPLALMDDYLLDKLVYHRRS